MTVKKITVEEFDRLFDEGSDEIDQYIDWGSFRRLQEPTGKVDIDLPEPLIAWLDREAQRQGVSRQALIKRWLEDRLDAAA